MRKSIAVAAVILPVAAQADVRLASLFQDHMVLQRDSNATIWGWADPGEPIAVTGTWNKAKVTTTANKSGAWSCKLKTGDAAGSYKLIVQGKNKVEISDVVLGEVWICSGQSNMEWSVGQHVPKIDNSDQEVANGSHPEIRLFTVPRKGEQQPQSTCGGTWSRCDPKSLAPFSATAYFFGRELHRKLGVPIGLISTNVGGTEAELWTSEAALRAMPDFERTILAQDQKRSAWEREFTEWLEECLGRDPGWPTWSEAGLDDSDWTTLTNPVPWSKAGMASYDGTAWYRSEFDVPENTNLVNAVLYLPPIDDQDITFINGVQVGSTSDWQSARTYRLPQGALKHGKNLLAIRVLDGTGEGGFEVTATLPRLEVGGKVVRFQKWRMKLGVEGSKLPKPPANDLRQYSTLYNAMIAPLVPFSVRGAIWYQGESNVGRAEQYRTLFPAMIENWRRDFANPNMPFFYVQIAPFTYGNEMSPELREAQMMTLKLKNTGMVVTTDITPNVRDIHPSQKREVGERLALWALAKTYGKKGIEHCGPLYRSMKVEGDSIRLEFDHVGGGLVCKGDRLTEFTVAGADKVFHPAEAKIVGGSVVVSSPNVRAPVAVRFGWSDSGIGNLFSKAGLPASPFRTDSWPGKTAGIKW